MTWVKRAGGARRGLYGSALPLEGAAAAPRVVQRPAETNENQQVSGEIEEPAPAYRVTSHRQAVCHRVILEVLAGFVTEGKDPELSMLYADAVEAFGSNSAHFKAACQGRTGVGYHYQRNVAGGRFAN